jgi:hypothetical protein
MIVAIVRVKSEGAMHPFTRQDCRPAAQRAAALGPT